MSIIDYVITLRTYYHFFNRTLDPGKHIKVQEGEQEVSHCQPNNNFPVPNLKLNSQPSLLFFILCTRFFGEFGELN